MADAIADVVVLGAGMAGLVGARVLEQAGLDVVVLDKGRRPGGRMATRRPDGPQGPVFDHGAQFVTLRAEELADETARWRDNGWLVEWFRGSPDGGADGEDGHPRYRGAPYQRGLPEALAVELADVRCGVRVEAVGHDGTAWVLRTADGPVRGRALLATPPAPQLLDLLAAGDVALPPHLGDELRRVTFSPCIAVLVEPDGRPDLPPSGIVRLPDHPVLDVVVDVQAKGASPEPAVVVHGAGDWSAAHWDDDEAGRRLLDAASEVMDTGGRIRHVQRWRFSAPSSRHDDLAPGATSPGALRVAGDAFAGGRVEGAALSGWTAAQRLVSDLP